MALFWEYFAFLANSLVFLLMGILFTTLFLSLDIPTLPILMIILVVVIARAISIYCSIGIANLFKSEANIPSNWQHLLSWGSLRGSLAVIMVLLIPDDLSLPDWTYTFSVKEFIIAITIHNFPEGMSVGVSFGSGDYKNGTILAIAIALQNIPEGLAVALPLIGLGYHKWKAVGIALLTGLVEPVGGLLGVTAVTVFSPLLPAAMGFAAGAMLFVISEEIIPETHAKGRSRHATFSLMIGFIIMMALDNMLG